MKTKYENLDALLDQNAARQLGAADSDRLYADIQRRLNQTCRRPHQRPLQSSMLRWAAGLSAAAAMVTAVFFLRDTRPQAVELPAGQRAAVRLIESDARVRIAMASEEIIRTAVTIQPAAQNTEVRFNHSQAQVAQCEVTVIDQNGHAEKERDLKPSWVIIIPSRTEESDNTISQEQLDIACLL